MKKTYWALAILAALLFIALFIPAEFPRPVPKETNEKLKEVYRFEIAVPSAKPQEPTQPKEQ